jgi:hypothetical protein
VFSVIRRIVSIALPILVLAAATSNAGPFAGVGIRGGAPPEPKVCATIPATPVNMSPSQTPAWNDEPVCGGRANDTLRSKLANTIIAYQGDDTIYAAQDPPVANEINGGPGKDRATVDDDDLANLTGVELCKLNGKGKWRSCEYLARMYNLRHPAARRELDYPSYESYVQCRMIPGTTRRQIMFLVEPTVRAVDATSHPDWQTVAYQASLYKWTGVGPATDTTDDSGWTFVAEKPWLWDRTVDETAVPTVFGFFNYWRTFTDNERSWVWLNVDGPGQYRVGLTYHWYATKNVPEHDEYYWASAHFGDDQYEVPDHKWCNFAT